MNKTIGLIIGFILISSIGITASAESIQDSLDDVAH